MSLNASGVRDTARGGQSRTRAVLNALQTKGRRSHPSLHRSLAPAVRMLWRLSSAVWTTRLGRMTRCLAPSTAMHSR